jgi:superfamily II DNA or RNA helicase
MLASNVLVAVLQKTASRTRPDQNNVFNDLVEYVADASERPAVDALPMGRIILPSRTGKTVIAGKFIGESGLTATFLVPTKTLLEQAVGDLRKLLPGAPVGCYYADGKKLVERGVNVITYQSLVGMWSEKGKLLPPLARSALVFADEGHTAMTARRMMALTKGFDPKAPRIAMTATPDYDFERALGKYFPDLIHELSLGEAMDLDLLAPVRVWVAEVDADASRVRMIAGNYDEVELGEIMSSAPFFKMANIFRYHPDNIGRSALICCSTRRQAAELRAYLIKFRPQDRPKPALVDKDTSREKRAKLMAGFENGKIDTIINVRAMLLGWNSPHCKVLIDLAPSTSHVLAMQKYFRPMTKWGNREARIYLLTPSNLPKMPLLPTDFFFFGDGEYRCGDLIASRNRTKTEESSSPVLRRKSLIAGVTLKSRIVLAQRFERPKLDPGDRESVRAVCLSNSAIKADKICGYQRFRWLYFDHELFKGHGWQLLRFLGVASDKIKYLSFMAGMFAEAAREQYLEIAGMTVEERRRVEDISCYEDAVYFVERVSNCGSVGVTLRRSMQQGSRALFGPECPSPETIAVGKETFSLVLKALNNSEILTPKEKDILRLRFGLDGEELTLDEVGLRYERSRERMRGMEEQALGKIRKSLCKRDANLFFD